MQDVPVLERFQLEQCPVWALHFKDKQLEEVHGKVVGMITDLDNITSEGRVGFLGLQNKSWGRGMQ